MSLWRDPAEGDGPAFVKCTSPSCPCQSNPNMRPPVINPPPKPPTKKPSREWKQSAHYKEEAGHA